jgi:hypothetical protein
MKPKNGKNRKKTLKTEESEGKYYKWYCKNFNELSSVCTMLQIEPPDKNSIGIVVRCPSYSNEKYWGCNFWRYSDVDKLNNEFIRISKDKLLELIIFLTSSNPPL